ncbi:MAG: ribosomal RNA small subunit methyltransferase H [Candidatus Mesenet longicola]|uniref:Ribosomal RNA small subunit methyltransferase H n=1 Tax=Candidatus Mesenet longicola TaxID=1892558 RepID=A0A8J3HP51_9RICK|nr:MAG: ribosomal RNA small subunit methyltransferase H [Candidatus Mesenet longicola]GHM59113.1 MAG: ribosomal RNA small subunit methyltransferase H [Candidatus Mesenet longicola]
MHKPVLLQEVMSILAPKDNEIYVDATFGAGGYSRKILQLADSKVYAIDRDKSVHTFFDELNSAYPQKLELFTGKFSKMKELLAQSNINYVDGVIFDIGVSSMQLADGERGFSFMHDGPLDMRMNQSSDYINAETFVNTLGEKEIADTIYKYSGERCSRRIAKAIVNARQKKTIKSTLELANIIRSVIPRGKIDAATRTFQAIRIWVNDELGELEKGLKAASEILNTGGRLIVVSFHSLEDRIVKNYFNQLCGKNSPIPTPSEFTFINKKVIRPSREETQTNPRARSAKLRAIIKL